MLKFKHVIFRDLREETSTLSGHISDFSPFGNRPPPELDSELQWLAHPNMDTLSTVFSLIFYVYLPGSWVVPARLP